MRISTRCSIALHLLVLLDVFRGHKLTSELLAASVGCNPVVVRSLLGSLRRAGIVEIQRGSGGASLAADPEEVTLWTVYQAVETTPLEELLGMHPNPSARCPVGRRIGALLARPYGMIADSLREAMAGYTLKQLTDDYHARKREEEEMRE